MKPPRLSRLDRIYTKQSFYFLTLRTYNRLPILTQSSLHQTFRIFSEDAVTRGVFVGRYVIMPDHIHLFAIFDEQTSISSWVKSQKNYLSKALRSLNIPTPRWQKGYFDHLLRSEESYGSKWEYVFHNPVRHGLVSEPVLWSFQGEINTLTFH